MCQWEIGREEGREGERGERGREGEREREDANCTPLLSSDVVIQQIPVSVMPVLDVCPLHLVKPKHTQYTQYTHTMST